MSEFWNDQVTDKSWKTLLELAKEADFVLIGGWAVYLWTHGLKSKDIDLITDYEGLGKLAKHGLKKNERLAKYEIRIGETDADIYVPYYSKLAVPCQEVMERARKVEGLKTASAEDLLLLKQQAEIARRGTVKGQKDAIDLMLLASRAGVDWKNYAKIAKENGLHGYDRELARVAKNFDLKNLKYVEMNPAEFKKFKQRLLASLKIAE